ncbi:MAG: Ig-like domain-containing protein [Candidatus Scatovivens sp.]
MGKKKTLIISIIIFIIVAICAIKLILNKGYINGKSLVPYEETHELSILSNKEYLSVTEDEEAEIKVLLDGQEISKGYELEVSDKDLVKLEDNIIKAKKVGTVTITATLKEYDLVSSVDVTVYRPIKNMKLTANNNILKVGNDRQLTLTTTPSNATRTYLSYESSDESIATVNNNGIVTGVSKGTVTITVTDNITGETATVKQTVK